MGLKPETVERVLGMWDRWGRSLTADEFDGVSVAVVAEHAFVRAPGRLRAQLADPPRDLDALIARLGDEAGRVVGQGRLAYADDTTLQLGPTGPVETISPGDRRLAALERRVDTAEWLESSSDEDAVSRVGVVEENDLVALGSLFEWDATVAHFGVFTRADRRGRGLAARVTTPLIRNSHDRGLIPQWRSRVDNEPSGRVADRLGFVPLGYQMFVRVRPAPASSRTMEP